MFIYFKTFYFTLIINLLLISSLISLFINDTMILWFIMEINNFIFLFYLTLFMKNKKMIFLYFFIQAIASFLLLIPLILSYSINYYSFSMNQIMMISLLIKLGLPPLHFWLPMISMYMDWMMILILFSIQKIIPFIIIYLIINYTMMITMIIALSMIIPPFMMFQMNNLKKLMSYSSINQMGWMLMMIMISPKLWFIYLFIYSLTFSIFIYMISYYSSSNFSSWINLKTSNKLIILSMMINISGLPPFTFFLFKWYSMFIFINSLTSYIMMLIMLFSSFFMMYIYVNILIKMCLTHLMYSKMYNIFLNKNTTLWILSMLFMSIILFIY